LWVALDVHKFSIVAATSPPEGGAPELRALGVRGHAAQRREVRREGFDDRGDQAPRPFGASRSVSARGP
jgi:hypothetical protein